MVDWSLILTLGVILLATLLASFMRTRQRDRCLRDFDGFHVTVERMDDRVIWGVMKLAPTGFELLYRSDVQDDKHLETSYVVYKDEYADIQAIYRYTRDLKKANARRRAREVQRAFHPGPQRRLARSFRNFMYTATESVGEAVGVVIGTVSKPAATIITQTSETFLKDIGKNIVGYVGTEYDPLLERYIGTRVVVEVVEAGEVHEHVGVFKDYSANFLEILDIFYPHPQSVDVQPDTTSSLEDQVKITVTGRQLRVQNESDQPIYVERLTVGQKEKVLNAIVDAGEEINLHLDVMIGAITLHLRLALQLDMIVPRSHALVRHRAERYDPDTIFDIGRSLVSGSLNDKEIEQLQQVLRYTPHSAPSAARLGEIYIRQNNLEEAHRWLLQAYQHRRNLIDDGNRVAQNLRLVERRLGSKRREAGLARVLAEELADRRNGQEAATQISVEAPQESQ